MLVAGSRAKISGRYARTSYCSLLHLSTPNRIASTFGRLPQVGVQPPRCPDESRSAAPAPPRARGSKPGPTTPGPVRPELRLPLPYKTAPVANSRDGPRQEPQSVECRPLQRAGLQGFLAHCLRFRPRCLQLGRRTPVPPPLRHPSQADRPYLRSRPKNSHPRHHRGEHRILGVQRRRLEEWRLEKLRSRRVGRGRLSSLRPA